MRPTTPPHKPPVYDRIAPHYDRAMQPLERRFLARLRAATLRELPHGARLLEIGAGTGLNFPYYPYEANGVASEPSRQMLERARAKEHPSGVSFVCNRAEHLPFADGAFDAAFATLVFCSVASPAEAFAELRRVVKPGGMIVLLEHVRPAGLPGYLFDALNLLTVALFDDHFNRRTADEARRAGLEVVRIHQHFLGIVERIVCRV